MLMLQRPEITQEELGNNRTKFVIEPLEPGFGLTLGNTMRRALLSRVPGVAVTGIKIDGVNIEKIKLDELRSNVSLAFEESFLFSNSAKDNIAIGSIEASQEKVEEAAIIAKAHEFISQLPETYETKVGERGYGLSGGQRQRIALARAIVRNPKILILDDALSAVDASTEEEIRNELKNVMNKMTTLIITNRVPTIELCDEVLFIEGGKIRAQGKHEEILEDVASYRNLFLEQEKAAK